MGAADQTASAEDSGEPGGETDPAGSERLCALTRKEHAPEDLIRFVAAPSGEIIPDLARKLPGRGVWLSCDKTVVAAAIKAKVFARSLKRPVTVPEDLAERIGAQLEKRALEALSLANKAGLVTAGFAQVDVLIEAGEAAVLVHGADAAEGGRAKLDRKFAAVCRQHGREPQTITHFSIEQMSLAIGRANVVHAALKTGGATSRFLREALRFQRYAASPATASSQGKQFEG